MPQLDLFGPPPPPSHAVSLRVVEPAPAPSSPEETTEETPSTPGAKKPKIRFPNQREKVLDFIVAKGNKGATDDEISKGMGLPLQSINARRVELRKLGFIFDSRRFRRTRKDKPGAVWLATPEGLQAQHRFMLAAQEAQRLALALAQEEELAKQKALEQAQQQEQQPEQEVEHVDS